jgi:MarR family transcriptional regulator for hemolysin
MHRNKSSRYAMVESLAQPLVIPQKHLTGTLHEMSLMASRLFNRQVRELGLTRTQWQVLYWLYHYDGQTQTALAEMLSMARPPLGRVVDRLEEQGWVVRKDDPNDRRAKLVHLTDKVTPLIGPLEDIVEGIGETAMAGLSMRDRQKLDDLMKRVHANLSDAVERTNPT